MLSRLPIYFGLTLLTLSLGASQAHARSCSGFAVIKSFDAAGKTVEVDYTKGKRSKFFPRPEGSPADTSKIAKKCGSKVKKTTTVAVKATGGRLTVTQVRSNFEGKMTNDTEDPAWLPSKLEKLIADEETVVIVVRPEKKKKGVVSLTTIYLPITAEEEAEIERINNQAKDL